jgi:heptosyltransferase-2
MGYKTDCRLFTGYKPCSYKRPCDGCPHYDRIETRIGVVSLEALGAVLRSTCLLPAIRRKYPASHITWITNPNAQSLLQGNPEIDRLITLDGSTAALLQHLKFDVLFGVDKSLEAGALVERMDASAKFGFGLTGEGVIRPLNQEAEYQYEVGLDDELKFHRNQKPETQQITESMGLTWKRDPYILKISDAEAAVISDRRRNIIGQHEGIIGYNTGCSLLFPNKKLTVNKSIELIAGWRKRFPKHVVALLGGREDSLRQNQMKAVFLQDDQVVNTPTDSGLRSGMLWVGCADLVFSGCSLGMHIAIGLRKPVIAWFGVSCIQEVDLYDRGVKIQSPVGCSPCWKKSCSQELMCYDAVPTEEIIAATAAIFGS